MDEHTKSIHYLLMADHFMVQKALLSQIKDTELTMGQPKVLDYLKDHDGACQKDIAAGCHIEPASITAVLAWRIKVIYREVQSQGTEDPCTCI